MKCAKLAVTWRCNLKCKYCYVADRRVGDISDRVINEALEWGPSDVYVYGGEPTLYPGLTDIIRKFRHCNVVVQSNGICSDVLLRCAELGAKISLSYHRTSISDFITISHRLRDMGALESIECMLATQKDLRSYDIFRSIFDEYAVPQSIIGGCVAPANDPNSHCNNIMRFGIDSYNIDCAAGSDMRVYTPDGIYRCDQYMLMRNHSMRGPCISRICHDSWCDKCNKRFKV